VAPAIKHLQEAMRNDPDNSSYRIELKKWKAMEAQKDAGNDAFKKGQYQEV
jgi:DnaJ family protein C protein 7